VHFSIKPTTPQDRHAEHALCVDGVELPIFLTEQEAAEFAGKDVELLRLLSILQHPGAERANRLIDWLKRKNLPA
jgi:hypothetical protein